VEDGSLDAFGDRVFTDTRVRKALAELAAAPPESFLSAVTDKLGHPVVPPGALHRSLARVLDASVPSPPMGPTPLGPPKPPVGPPGPAKSHEYDLEAQHLANKSSLIRELWEDLDKYALSLGSDVTRRVRKYYVGYFRGKRSFCTIEIQKGRLLVYLSLSTESAQPWNHQVMRDVSKIGHFGMGGVEYSLVTVDQLDEVRKLIVLAYGQH
jgi:predicted transport protein